MLFGCIVYLGFRVTQDFVQQHVWRWHVFPECVSRRWIEAVHELGQSRQNVRAIEAASPDGDIFSPSNYSTYRIRKKKKNVLTGSTLIVGEWGMFFFFKLMPRSKKHTPVSFELPQSDGLTVRNRQQFDLSSHRTIDVPKTRSISTLL